MRLVYLESPYAGDVEGNIAYAREAMLDCLERGESPMVSHLLYTQCLDDSIANERSIGMNAGFAWAQKAHATVVYADLGLSAGMAAGVDRAISEDRKIEYRKIR